MLTEEQSVCSIVSMVAGRVTGRQAFVTEKVYQQMVFSLEDAKSYVEKFLLIKDVEEELNNLNCDYFLKLGRDNAIFWYYQQNGSSDIPENRST